MENELENNRSMLMAEVMTPNMANFTGNVHGGDLMSLLDKVAYACAARYSGHYVVTLSADQIFFKKPIYVGELVTFLAHINYVGTSSMEVGIKVIAENLLTGKKRHTNSCYMTMVAVDENLKPVKVEPLVNTTEREKELFDKAKLRREMRMEYQQKHDEMFK